MAVGSSHRRDGRDPLEQGNSLWARVPRLTSLELQVWVEPPGVHGVVTVCLLLLVTPSSGR